MWSSPILLEMYMKFHKNQTIFRILGINGLNIYVSGQKFPQSFLYRSKKYCKSFKSFGEQGKKNIQQQIFANFCI